MNRRMIFFTTGRLLRAEAALLLLPLLTAVIYKEARFVDFLLTMVIAAVAGQAMMLLFRPKNHTIYAREGFVIVAFSWLAMSAVGALPFVFSGEIPNYVDALFETVSGFTTTGASLVPNVEVMSRSILMWRSFTHWVGGMGILVLVVALVGGFSDRSIHILRAEMPGPTMGKLVPRLKDTAKILYAIYVALTLIQIAFLFFGGMPFFDSVVHTFGTAGTGGFGIKADSIGGYSPYLQWVITIFMLLFGINFNLYYLALRKKFKDILRSEELWVYISLFLVSATIITLNILPQGKGVATSIRESAFQVSSIMTTTGYSTADFDVWPTLSKSILLVLMFIGACAGSTAGGIKVSRVVLLFKNIRIELRRLIHPRSVGTARFEGKPLDEQTSRSVGVYLAVYVVCFLIGFLLLCIEPGFDMMTNFSAVTACFNNIGPGFGAVGPALNYAGYSAFSKLVLTFSMLLGRLEIFPLLLAFSPSTWRSRR